MPELIRQGIDADLIEEGNAAMLKSSDQALWKDEAVYGSLRDGQF